MALQFVCASFMGFVFHSLKRRSYLGKTWALITRARGSEGMLGPTGINRWTQLNKKKEQKAKEEEASEKEEKGRKTAKNK